MDSCIVSCSNVICSYFKTSLKKRFPLYITVAGDTWIRCTAFFIFVNKIVDYITFFFLISNAPIPISTKPIAQPDTKVIKNIFPLILRAVLQSDRFI